MIDRAIERILQEEPDEQKALERIEHLQKILPELEKYIDEHLKED